MASAVGGSLERTFCRRLAQYAEQKRGESRGELRRFCRYVDDALRGADPRTGRYVVDIHEYEWRTRGVDRDSTSRVRIAVQSSCTDLRCRPQCRRLTRTRQVSSSAGCSRENFPDGRHPSRTPPRFLGAGGLLPTVAVTQPIDWNAARRELCWLRLAQPAYLCRSWKALGSRKVRVRGDASQSRRARSQGQCSREEGPHREGPRIGELDPRTRLPAEHDPTSLHTNPLRIHRGSSSLLPLRGEFERDARLSHRPRDLDFSAANPPFKIGTDMPLPLSGSSRGSSGAPSAAAASLCRIRIRSCRCLTRTTRDARAHRACHPGCQPTDRS